MRKHLAQQDWFAVTVDIVVVIVSILLAFQIERWASADLFTLDIHKPYMN